MKTVDAIKFFGTATRLAKELDISGAAVSMWGEDVPLGRAYQLQVLTKGKLQATPKEPNTNAAAVA